MDSTGVERVGLPRRQGGSIAFGTSDNRHREAVWDNFYLDQFAISNLMKLENPATEGHARWWRTRSGVTCTSSCSNCAIFR